MQADNGAGLDKGIIGLVNKGQPRSLDDWGVLRAWAWGDSRMLDYLQTDPDVDGTKVGVMGHSRGGKAALVAEVDDPRFAISFISSSGAGGADLYRRNYGETIGNIARHERVPLVRGQLPALCARSATPPTSMPVDSHEFIALVAPRASLHRRRRAPHRSGICSRRCLAGRAGHVHGSRRRQPGLGSAGRQGPGDNHVSAHGHAHRFGRVAFRQHEYGHTPAPNWPYFIEFADKEFKKR